MFNSLLNSLHPYAKPLAPVLNPVLSRAVALSPVSYALRKLDIHVANPEAPLSPVPTPTEPTPASDAVEQAQQQQQIVDMVVDEARSTPVTPAPADGSVVDPLFPVITDEYIAFLNKKLEKMPAQKILEWATLSLPHLYQTTAFGLTGLVVLDMLAKIAAEREGNPGVTVPNPVEMIFVDTLYHFKETLELAHRATTHYNTTLHIYKPANCETTADFERLNGERLWESDADIYDFLVKVEPARRAYAEHNVRAVITGRRRSQKGDRGAIPIIEIDRAASPPMLKLNPLASWDYDAVWKYVRENNVPYNVLHDQGYKSIGDVHSTRPTKEGEGERDGRWAGQQKSECGLHKDYLKMRASYVAAKKRKVALAAATSSEAVLVDSNRPVVEN